MSTRIGVVLLLLLTGSALIPYLSGYQEKCALPATAAQATKVDQHALNRLQEMGYVGTDETYVEDDQIDELLTEALAAADASRTKGKVVLATPEEIKALDALGYLGGAPEIYDELWSPKVAASIWCLQP